MMGPFGMVLAGAVGRGVIAGGDFSNLATNNMADGTYTLNGVACNFDDIVNLASDNTTFNQGTNIGVGGLKPASAGNAVSLEIVDSLAASLLASGFTVVVDGFFDSAVLATFWVDVHDPDYNGQSSAYLRPGAPGCELVPFVDGLVESPTQTIPLNVEHRIALTMTAGTMSYSINGGAVIATSGTVFDVSFTNIKVALNGQTTSRMRSFAFYTAADDADLPGLSTL